MQRACVGAPPLTVIVFIYHRSNNDSTISAVLNYDSDFNISVGYILLGPDIEEETVITAIESQFANFSHPLLIPTLMAELTAGDLMRKLRLVHDKLAKIELATGFSDWTKVTAKRDYLNSELQQWARELGALSCNFAFLEVAVQCTMVLNDFTLQEMGLMRNYVPASRRGSLKGITTNLINRVEFLSSNLNHMQAFGGIKQRMQAQQTVVSRPQTPLLIDRRLLKVDSYSISSRSKTML